MSARTATRATATQSAAKPAAAAPARGAARPALTPVRTALLQRACECGGTPGPTGECPQCHEKKKQQQSKPQSKPKQEQEQQQTVQRAGTGTAPAAVPPSVNRTLSAPGHPLDTPTRGFMESRFGQDFSGVRVHTDSQAAESARDVNARAYTVGQDIAFAPGQYQPHTSEGAGLLAHELAHTVQQSGLQRSADNLAMDSALHSPLEREASAAVTAVMQGQSPSVFAQRSAPVLSRAAWGICPAGTVLDATDKNIYDTAELYAVTHYQQVRASNKDAILTNNNKLEEFDASKSSEREMITAAQEGFYTKMRWTPPGVYNDVPVEPAKIKGLADEAEQKGTASLEVGPEPALKEPDIIDFKAREVYDVTTEKQTKGKVGIVQKNYADRLEAIRKSRKIGGKPWTAGTTLPPPQKISFSIDLPGSGDKKKSIVICFGATDFGTSPGVISYVPIDAAQSATTADDNTELYKIDVGTLLTFDVPPAGKKSTKFALDGSNLKTAQSVPGAVFKMLNRSPAGDTIDAELEMGKIPLEISKEGGLFRFKVNKKTRKLTLEPHKKKAVELKMLSSGYITKLEYSETTGLSGEAEIQPSIKLLSKIKLKVAFGPNKLDVLSEIPQDKLNVPIPGLKVTKASLGLKLYPDFVPSGELSFTIGPGGRNWVDGTLKASADADGFVAEGDLNAHIPGLDESTGHIVYRYAPGKGSDWSGQVKLTSTKIPRIKSAEFTLGFSDSGLVLAGGMKIDLPGSANELELNVDRNRGGGWVLSGKAKYTVPVKGVDPVQMEFAYDIARKALSGHGKTRFEVRGLSGKLDVYYNEGAISGKGRVDFEKGRAKGHILVDLDEQHRFSGEGEVTYKLTDDLIATVGVVMDKKQDVTLKGVIEYNKPIKLFGPLADNFDIFSVDITIPIPGLSIPGVGGIEGHIGGGLSAGYRIGEAVLRKIRVEGTIRPLDEDMEAAVTLSAEFYCPVHADISGKIHAGIGVSIGIAGVSGNFEVTATANFDASVRIPAKISYEKGNIAAEAGFEASGGLSFGLKLGAFVEAEAGVWRFKVHKRWDWTLAEHKYNPGNLNLGLKLNKPLRYSTGEGIQIPSLSDFEWIKPDIDTGNLLKSTVDSADRKGDDSAD